MRTAEPSTMFIMESDQGIALMPKKSMRNLKIANLVTNYWLEL